MKYRVILTYILVGLALNLLSGCNSSKPTDISIGESIQTEEETQPPVTTTEEVVTTPLELTVEDKLSNTCWSGADGNLNVMEVSFIGDQIEVVSNGYRTDISGYWEVDEESQRINVYEDSDCTQLITYYDYTLCEFESGQTLLYMESLYLAKVDSTDVSFEELCEDVQSQADTLATATDGTYWVGTSDNYADFFVCNYSDIYLYVAQFNSEVTTYYDGKWGITYGNGFYIVDSQSGECAFFNWSLNSDATILYLTDLYGDTLEFLPTDATSFNEAIAIVNSHLDGSYVAVTTTEETTTEETTTTTTEETTSQEVSLGTDSTLDVSTDEFGNPIATTTCNGLQYFNNSNDPNLNPDDANYDDAQEYFDNYTKAPENLYPNYYTTEAPSYDYNDSYDYNYDSDNDYQYGF